MPSSSRAASFCALLLCLAGTATYAVVLNRVYPIEQWLFWSLAMLWGWVALFSAACTSFGQLVLVRGLGIRDLPALESAVFSMAIGVVAFTMGMYLGGALALYSKVWAVTLPVVLLLLGAPDGLALARRLVADITAPARRGPLTIAVAAYGVLCVAMMYLQHMTPEAINYDASWCHLSVAQDYARAHRIIAFPADYMKNVPQLAPLIHTWGWLLPGMTDPLRWMLVMHNELGLFAWTLAGVAAGVRYLADEQSLRGAWVAFFLFPIIFVYDHNLGGAADHVAGFFSIPILLAALRLRATFALPMAVVLGIACAGGLLTKYQALYMIAPAAAVLGVRWVRLLAEHGVARLRPPEGPSVPLRNLIWVPVLVGGVALLLFSPHLLRGLIFYGNPVYPLGRSFFPSHPDFPNAQLYFDNYASDPNYWLREGAVKKLRNALRLFFVFSFQPHYSFTKDLPSFGSLFTLLLPAVLFVPKRARIAPAAIIASGAVLMWGYVYFVDRNLQTFMPVLACVTGALVVELWHMGRVARAGLIPLVALQLVWGGDALFYSGRERLRASIDLINTGYDGTAATRFVHYRSTYLAIRNALPKNARLLLHTSHMNLGIDREVMLDWANFQGLITYAGIHTPRELYDYFKKLGITHMLYEHPMTWVAPSKQEEVVWNALITGHVKLIGTYGPYRLIAMPKAPPPQEASYRVASFGQWGYTDGVYPVERMSTVEYTAPGMAKYAQPTTPMPADDAQRAALIGDVNAVLTTPLVKLGDAASQVLKRDFKRVVQFQDRMVLYLRKEAVHRDR